MSGRRRGKRQGWEREKQGWEEEKKKERQGWERDRKRDRTISRETEVGETHREREREREREPLRKRGMVGERKIGIERETETGVRER